MIPIKHKLIHKRNCSNNSTIYENMNKANSPPPTRLEPAALRDEWIVNTVTNALSYLHR